MLTEKSVIPDTAAESADLMSPEQVQATFNAAARRYLRMSGAEFLEKWDRGYFKTRPDLASRVDAVSILFPLIGRQ